MFWYSSLIFFWVLALNRRSHIHADLFNIFFICYLVPPWPIFGHYQEDSLTHPMLITAFLSFFVSEVTGNFITTRFEKLEMDCTDPQSDWNIGKLMKTKKVKIYKKQYCLLSVLVPQIVSALLTRCGAWYPKGLIALLPAQMR